MLRSITIKNYALLADAEIEFGSGLNILTGETGTGKSILIGAIGCVLGERADTGMLRTGAARAVIEARFTTADNRTLLSFLTENDIEMFDDEILLRREISATGRSRAFINDSPVSLTLMQQTGDLLVDLHGQHEHQSLFKTRNHLLFLDSVAQLDAGRSAVASAFHVLNELKQQRQKLFDKQAKLLEKRELYEFQLTEIDKVSPQPGEEEALFREEKISRSAGKLFSLTDENYSLLYEQEKSIYSQLSRVLNDLKELHAIDERFEAALQDCESAQMLIEELASFIRNYRSRVDFSPEKAEQIQIRIAELTGLKKRFNRDLEAVLVLKDQIAAELTSLENFDQEIAKLDKKVSAAEKQLGKLCLRLSEQRKAAASELQERIPDVLTAMGMANCRFKVALQYHRDPDGIAFGDACYQVNEDGMDIAEFLISTNEGEDLRPLIKVASGGEISRIMLALKSAIAQEGQIPTLVFDEIDSGVSGRIARSVGNRLKELSAYHQVLCITHLPQIASMGEHHWFVEKQTQDGRTVTRFRKLAEDERATEIAKLLAGEKITDVHLDSARQLLQEAERS